MTVVGGATGDYAGNHGDTSPGSTGEASDFYFPGNGTGIINSSSSICNADGTLRGQWKHKTALNSVFDGTSNTILAGELHVPSGKLNTTPHNGPIFHGQVLVTHSRVAGPGVPLLTPSEEAGDIFGFGSSHPGVTNFVFADGSTQSIGNGLDVELLGNLCNRSDGNITNRN